MHSVSLPPLSRLRPFEAAARHENFSKAAEELGLTQTAISRQIGQLEGELGLKLFERRNRSVFLTEEGRRLGRVVGEALSLISQEVSLLTGAGDLGTVILRCQLCEAFYWLMPRLSRFHALYPELQLQVVSAIEPLTQAGEHFDVAIQTSGRPSGSARLLFTASDEIFPVCAPGFAGEASLPLEVNELLRFRLLTHRVVPQDWFDWPDWFDACGERWQPSTRVVCFDSYPLVLQAAVAGQGIALGWQRTVSGLLAEGKLVRASAASIKRPTEISVFRGPGRGGHANVDRLIQWLRAELQ
ncbi:LysR family transcriptional regulator [Rhodobacterales bacterium]|nr:LysR family transcriptional regulator [Rhodobacterales bacterium]